MAGSIQISKAVAGSSTCLRPSGSSRLGTIPEMGPGPASTQSDSQSDTCSILQDPDMIIQDTLGDELVTIARGTIMLR